MVKHKTHILVEEDERRYFCHRVGVDGVMVVDVVVRRGEDGVVFVGDGVCISCLNAAPDDRVKELRS